MFPPHSLLHYNDLDSLNYANEKKRQDVRSPSQAPLKTTTSEEPVCALLFFFFYTNSPGESISRANILIRSKGTKSILAPSI